MAHDDGVGRGLRARQTGRQRRLASAQRQIDRQVVSAELEHPRRCHRRRPDECEVVLVLAERRAAARPTPAAAAAASARVSRRLASPQHFVTAHDVDDLSITIAAQRGGQQRHDSSALGRREISHPDAGALKHRAR